MISVLISRLLVSLDLLDFCKLLQTTLHTVIKAVELLDGPSKNTLLKSNKYNSKGEILYLDTVGFPSSIFSPNRDDF
jgi:hypothetical protein